MIPDRECERTDPRVLRTRKLIADAFQATLAEKGFEELSVQDVADHAGINRATFYAHYADKYDLMAEWIRKDFTGRLEEWKLSDRNLSAEAVRDLFTAVCGYAAGLHGHCKPPHRHLDWMLEQEITGCCADLFCRWAGKRDKSPGDVPQRLRSTAAAGALYALVLEWLGAGKGAEPETFVTPVLPFVTDILRAE